MSTAETEPAAEPAAARSRFRPKFVLISLLVVLIVGAVAFGGWRLYSNSHARQLRADRLKVGLVVRPYLGFTLSTYWASDLYNSIYTMSGTGLLQHVSPSGRITTRTLRGSDGKPLTSWGLAIDSRGFLYTTVRNVTGYTVDVLNPSGTIERQIDLPATQDRPVNLALGRTGTIYVVNKVPTTTAHRNLDFSAVILRLVPGRTWQSVWSGTMTYPAQIAVDPSGAIYYLHTTTVGSNLGWFRQELKRIPNPDASGLARPPWHWDTVRLDMSTAGPLTFDSKGNIWLAGIGSAPSHTPLDGDPATGPLASWPQVVRVDGRGQRKTWLTVDPHGNLVGVTGIQPFGLPNTFFVDSTNGLARINPPAN